MYVITIYSKYGSEELKENIYGIISGDLIGCIGITEPDAGSDEKY